MADLVTLSVDGRSYGGWKTVSIKRSLEQIAGTFELTVTEHWPDQPQRRAIATGARCTVAIGGEVVITGWVDDVRPFYDAQQHGVTIAGRDATGDLVDCAAVQSRDEWDEITLDSLAQVLCKPFGIGVRREVDVGKGYLFKLQPGDSVFAELERFSRAVGVLLASDGRGNLLLTRAGEAGRVADRLQLGRNILRAEGDFSDRDRYSEIFVLGQRGAVEGADAKYSTEGKGFAADPGVKRYRPLIVFPEMTLEDDDLARRAAWEARHRAGRARRATITVQGWRHAGGDLWRPNTLVPVRDEFLAIDGELLVASVEFKLDEGGSLTTLSLAPQAAFDLIPFASKELVGW